MWPTADVRPFPRNLMTHHSRSWCEERVEVVVAVVLIPDIHQRRSSAPARQQNRVSAIQRLVRNWAGDMMSADRVRQRELANHHARQPAHLSVGWKLTVQIPDQQSRPRRRRVVPKKLGLTMQVAGVARRAARSGIPAGKRPPPLQHDRFERRKTRWIPHEPISEIQSRFLEVTVLLKEHHLVFVACQGIHKGPTEGAGAVRSVNDSGAKESPHAVADSHFFSPSVVGAGKDSPDHVVSASRAVWTIRWSALT
ncbi:hypothetical protein DFJ67_7017 [Asanoa ferruginea]|uniref:Uncharacterized protein n=1 Tax=Asanoa ferruginea TaxID=53367 RepID=A0A3D9ZUR2_9ACTN|nr:hypothetical protein DFJ67_7017 [Asanoa ferruginea]